MMRAHDLILTSGRGISYLGNYQRAREFCEAVKASAPRGIRVGHLVAPSPPLPGTTPRWRGMRAEPNSAGSAARRTLERLPAVVQRALIVYLLGWPVLCFAVMDLGLFSVQGKSWLGPALDVILMVFGGGLVIISLVAVMVAKQKRYGPVSR